MKAHIGADAESSPVHSVHVTVANENDVAHAQVLLHGDEKMLFADAGYMGVAKREEILHAQAERSIRTDIDWNVAARRGKIIKLAEGTVKSLTIALENVKAQVRPRVEHLFHVVKNLLRHKKTRYKGLAKTRRRCSASSGSPIWCW